MADGSEKREAHRALLGTKVSWTADNLHWQEDNSQDVSSTGMMLRTAQQIEPGTMLTLAFKLPNRKFLEPITAEAEVMRAVRRQERQIGVGLRFIVLRSHDSRVVQEFVCRIIGLPLDDVIDSLGDAEDDGYSYQMDRLLCEADERNARLADQQLIKDNARLRKDSFRTWRERGKRIALLALFIFLAFKVKESLVGLNILLPGR
ncbi:PilZ domain-containing protein [Thiovibrio frasassiensis]|uniref:PilZ domain-containing protein n=1 Tax=Thiovibrio frasassiensis TaxID=2984131 RepID=A0A9X4MFA9_9BACT|nr:PilZ domain-containing protein [Thiovibrio frasassiensis]MDG4476176.1 PilZ domain-containing protein [Thiovibrio frasassiensis]